MAIQLHRMRVEFNAVALLVGRICFASDFLLFGSRKLANPSIIYNLIEARHLPGELVYPTIVLQLGCGLLVLLGYQTRLAAAVLPCGPLDLLARQFGKFFARLCSGRWPDAAMPVRARRARPRCSCPQDPGPRHIPRPRRQRQYGTDRARHPCCPDAHRVSILGGRW